MDYQLYWTEQMKYKFLSLFHQRYNKIIDKPLKLILAPMFGYFLAYPLVWLLWAGSLVRCIHGETPGILPEHPKEITSQ